jgi:hypothetical protein
LRWRAELRAEQGRYEDAFDDIKSCYRLGRHLKGDKALVEQLVGMAIEDIATRAIRDILSEHKIESTALINLQEDLEQITADEDFVVSLKMERLCMYDELQRCFTEDRIGGGHLYPFRTTGLGGGHQLAKLIVEVILPPERWPGVVHALFLHPNKQQTRKMADRYYSWMGNIMRKNPAQIRAEGIDIEKETMEIIKGNLLLEFFTPAIGRINEISYRNKADVNSTLAIIAILRYKQDKGNFPESLDELITVGYLKELPIDSWSDKPLIYKRTEDNFILYSVSLNFADDGGQVYKDEEGRPRLWNDESGDAVFWPVQKPEIMQ